MAGESWWDYVRRVSDGAMQKDIAARIGVNPATVSGWQRGTVGTPSATKVIEFAREYKVSPVEALLVANYLQAADLADVGVVEIVTSLDDVPDAALVKGLADRLAKLRRLLSRGDDAQDWGSHWRREDPGVNGMKHRNQGK